MRSEYTHKFNPDLVEMNEKLRKDTMRTLEPYGAKPISDLPEMSEGERAKWFFWNMHENLDEFRKLEPTLIGQIMCSQMTVTEGQLADVERIGIERHLVLHCKWHLRLVYSAYQNEDAYPIGDGSVDFAVADSPPTNLVLQKDQKGWLDSDNSLYPNQIYLYGWISEAIWKEIKDHLYMPTPNCHTDILLRDNCVFPVKAGFDFVAGPPGSIGVTNMEFRMSSYSAERRSSRRSETLQL